VNVLEAANLPHPVQRSRRRQRTRGMDASHPEGEAAAGWVTIEEWSGSSASALSRTAVLTASASSLTAHRWPLPPSLCFVPSFALFPSHLTCARACVARLGYRRFGSRWGRIGSRMLGAFVPEVSDWHAPPPKPHSSCINNLYATPYTTDKHVVIPLTSCCRRQQLYLFEMNFAAQCSSPLFLLGPVTVTDERAFVLPCQGFPGSVTPDYVPFQMWDTLQVRLPARRELSLEPCCCIHT
jgi:hypothetical protein